jgi:hypothetical protein
MGASAANGAKTRAAKPLKNDRLVKDTFLSPKVFLEFLPTMSNVLGIKLPS